MDWPVIGSLTGVAVLAGVVGVGAYSALRSDEPLVRRPFARVLRDLGCEVMIASGASEAIHLLGAMPEIDLIITDVIMPDENAFDLIPRVKKVRPDLPTLTRDLVVRLGKPWLHLVGDRLAGGPPHDV